MSKRTEDILKQLNDCRNEAVLYMGILGVYQERLKKAAKEDNVEEILNCVEKRLEIHRQAEELKRKVIQLGDTYQASIMLDLAEEFHNDSKEEGA